MVTPCGQAKPAFQGACFRGLDTRSSMLAYSLRGSVPLIALYATICVVWAEFAHRVPATIIETIYSPSIPNLLSGEGILPAEYYLDRWSMIAAAVPLAAILHLVIVLLIGAMDRPRLGRIFSGVSGSDCI
jgi:hypothetical protein